VASQTARQATQMRTAVQRELAMKEKEKKDRELRELAVRARMDRQGGGGGAPPSLAAREAGGGLPGPPQRHAEVNLFLPACPLLPKATPPLRMLGRQGLWWLSVDRQAFAPGGGGFLMGGKGTTGRRS